MTEIKATGEVHIIVFWLIAPGATTWAVRPQWISIGDSIRVDGQIAVLPDTLQYCVDNPSDHTDAAA
ncbi:MAG: hypothetical protein HKN47_26915 [Pirellulaceae bacterium]|nr:hypothetical protein [Pirellulaceae bacterium]